MDRDSIIKEMRDSVGTKEPVLYFEKMADLFCILFDRIDSLEVELSQIKTQSALAIQWEPRVASGMLTRQIDLLKENKDTYEPEILELKRAFVEDRVTQNYHDFCEFWVSTLGWHPFLDY